MIPQVEILLATYNGEKFLKEQIDSILAQTYAHFQLSIRDDGSTDQTVSIIQDFARRYPEKIKFIDDTTHLGALGCFSELLVRSQAPYVMFADQDDVWMKEKVFITLQKMKEMETQYGREKPLLVHSDLVVVNENLKELSPSFWKYTHLSPKEGARLNRILVQNEVTGCTMMLNRPLVALSAPVSKECAMHDWWVGIIAAAFGHIGVISKPLIYYRQHGKNALGAVKFGSVKQILMKRSRTQERKMAQSAAFLFRYEKTLSPDACKMVSDFVSMKHSTIVRNRYLTLKHRFFRHGVLRNLYCFFLMRYP